MSAGRRLAFAVLGLVFAGCGGGGRPAVENPGGGEAEEEFTPTHHESTAPKMDDDEEDDGVEIEGLRGHLSPADVEAGVSPHFREIMACHTSRTKKRRYIGGKVELGWTVNKDGTVKTAQIRESDLGAWDIEKCLLDIAREIQFKAPRGGEADFSLPVDFDARQGVRWWDEERADEEVADNLDQLEECPSQPTNVWVTFYVGTRGAVQSAGFASPSKQPIDDAWADCAAAAIESWTLSDPEGRMVKSGFRYHPE